MRARDANGTIPLDAEVSSPGRDPAPAVWLPTIRAGTGADVFANRLCDGLNARGIRAEISWLPHRAEYLPWTVPKVEPPAWANVVHVNSWLPRRFWPKGLPAVVTVHHLVHDPAFRPFRSPTQAIYHEALIRPRELRAIREADAVTTVSSYVKGTVVAFSGRTDIKVIHNWVDCDVFSPAESRGKRNPGPFRLFMAGSHSRRKGIDLLPDLAEALGPGFEIRLAGGNAATASFADNVIELGRISEAELVHEFQSCDAVLSLSRYEGFGYTALEGMACGKPFIGFRNSALIEVVEHGAHGYLADSDDILGIAAQCRKLAESTPLVTRMACAARSRATEVFRKESSVKTYTAVYELLLIRACAAALSGSGNG